MRSGNRRLGLAQVPALARLPERLGNTFAPAATAATSVVAGAAVAGGLGLTGALTPLTGGGPYAAYVVNDTSNSVTLVRSDGDRVVSTVAAGSIPLGIAITPDGHTADVDDDGTVNGVTTVTPIDLTTTPPTPGTPISTGTRQGANFVAITPDGHAAYDTDPGSGQVTPFDLTT